MAMQVAALQVGTESVFSFLGGDGLFYPSSHSGPFVFSHISHILDPVVFQAHILDPVVFHTKSTGINKELLIQ